MSLLLFVSPRPRLCQYSILRAANTYPPFSDRRTPRCVPLLVAREIGENVAGETIRSLMEKKNELVLRHNSSENATTEALSTNISKILYAL